MVFSTLATCYVLLATCFLLLILPGLSFPPEAEYNLVMSQLEPKFAALFLAVLLANLVEASTGFGATVIAITLAAHWFAIDFLVPTIIPLNTAVCLYLVCRYHRGINRKVLFNRVLPLVLLGMPVGYLIFRLVPADRLKFGYGLFILGFAGLELWRMARSGPEVVIRPLSASAAALWLICGGIVHGLYSSGGPLVVYYASRALKDKSEFRATLSGLWLILSVVLFITHLAGGTYTLANAKTDAFLLPSLVLGIILGELLHSRLPEKSFRGFVFVILAFAGATILVGG